MRLEERDLLAVFTPTLVPNPLTTSLTQVVATPPQLPVKLLTVMNNSPWTVYPILYNPNSTPAIHAGRVVSLTIPAGGGGSGYHTAPKVVFDNAGTGGSGAAATALLVNGRVAGFRITNPGSGYATAPKVSFDNAGTGGAGAAATANLSTSPMTSLYDPLDPYLEDYRGYVGEFNPLTNKTELGLQPGRQVTLQLPLVFWNGGRMFFMSNGANPLLSETDPGNPLQNNNVWNFDASAPSFVVTTDQAPYSATFADPATGIANPNGRVMWWHKAQLAKEAAADAPGQLVEWTFRDKDLVFYAPDMPDSEKQLILNYDVSYVDNLTLPAVTETTQVHFPNNTLPPALASAALGTDLTVPQQQQAVGIFTSTIAGQANTDLGTYFGGKGYDKFFLPKATLDGLHSGIDFLKLASGYNLIVNSALNDVASTFDNAQYQLLSGGTRATVTTNATSGTNNGVVTVGDANITGVDAAKVAQIAPGMLVINPTFFAPGTYVVSASGTTITMSRPARASNNNDALTFAGSQWTSSTGGTSGSSLVGLQSSVVQYLRPGMLVKGPGITTYALIKEIPTFTSVTLVDQLGNPVVLSPGSGAYVFTGAPSSYVVDTLLKNWYLWADYYVQNVNATVQSSAGSVTGTNNLKDKNALILSGLSPAVVSQLKVGNVVTGPGIDSNPVATAIVARSGMNYKAGDVLTVSGGTFTKPATITVAGVSATGAITAVRITECGSYTVPPVGTVSVTGGSGTGAVFDLTFTHTTISKILSATSVELSNAVLTSGSGTYQFNPPLPIPRSSEVPAFGTHTLSFDGTYNAPPGREPLKFAQVVYDLMQAYSRLDPNYDIEGVYMSQSAAILAYVLGGNIGTFDLQGTTTTGKTLPDERAFSNLRDELKSVLRGVNDFSETLEFSSTGQQQWYPDPKAMVQGALINGLQSDFGVFNLNPYVWFIHVELGMSGYGFSLDDDTANTTTASNNLVAAIGGTASTAPGTAHQKLSNLELYTNGAPFGTIQDQGFISEVPGIFGMERISGLKQSTVTRLNPFQEKNGPGALVTGTGMTTLKTRVLAPGPNIDGQSDYFVDLNQPSPLMRGTVTTYTFSGFPTVVQGTGVQLPSPLPLITGMSAGSGKAGDKITLTGRAFSFTQKLGVTFNGIPAPEVVVHSDSSLTVTVPAGASSGRIGVRAKAGTGFSTSDFIIDTDKATLTLGISPTTIQHGTNLTVTLKSDRPLSVLPRGTIIVKKAGVTIGTGTVRSGSAGNFTATITYTGQPLPLGTHHLGIEYNGSADPIYKSATGTAVVQVIDTRAPVVTISRPSVAVTGGGPVVYTVIYSDPFLQTVTLSAADVILTRTGTANGLVAVTGTGAVRQVVIHGITGNGTLGISLRAGTARDSLGHVAGPAGPSIRFAVRGNRRLLVQYLAPPALLRRSTTQVFNILVSNAGNQLSRGAFLLERLPALTTFNPALSTPGWRNLGGGFFRFDLNTVPSGSRRIIKFAVKVAPNITSNTRVVNRVAIRDSFSPRVDLAVAVANLLVVSRYPRWPVT